MKIKLTLIVGTLLLIVGGIFVFQGVASAASSETYTWAGTGSDSKGLGGTQITASGGNLSKSYTLNRAVASNIGTDYKTKGDTVFYSGLVTFTANGKSCNKTLYVEMTSSTAVTADINTQLPSGKLPCGGSEKIGPANAGPVGINVNEKALQAAGYLTILATPLSGAKTAYYQALGSKAPCSSQGCDDSTWDSYVGTCWTSAENATPSLMGNNSVAVDTAALIKSSFASCLSNKIGNKVSAGAILALLKDVDAQAVINAGDQNYSAAQAAAAALSNAALTQAQNKIVTQTSCNIPQLGWILCPVINTGANIADASYSFLADNFLDTDPSLVNSNPNAVDSNHNPISTGTYDSWKIMRTIANVVFVIAFLIIIFSQLTGQGVSNYGIKKMLPRLIISAILVNVSFFVCQVAVDLSNILGYSVEQLFTSVAGNVVDQTGTNPSTIGSAGGNTWGTLALVIIGGSLVWINIGAVLLMLVTVIVALAMIFLILIVRKVLIVLLVVVSPLAFVAYLLPNTESLYKKWQKALVALLMLFPIIGVVYGASKLASAIIQSSSSTTLMQIVGAAALVLPLFVVPTLLKAALNGFGNLGGMINNLGNKAQSSTGRLAKSQYDKSRLGQYKTYRGKVAERRRAQIQSGVYSGKGGNANPRNWMSNLNSRFNNSAISGQFGDSSAAGGIALAEGMDTEEDKNSAARLRRAGITRDEMRVLATGGTVKGLNAGRNASLKRAAASAVVASSDSRGITQLWDHARGLDDSEESAKFRRNLADGLSSSRPGYVGQGSLNALREGTNTSMQETVVDAINNHGYSPASIATEDKDNLEYVNEVISQNPSGLQAEALKQLRADASTALNDPRLNTSIKKNLGEVSKLAGPSSGTTEQLDIPHDQVAPSSTPTSTGGSNAQQQPAWERVVEAQDAAAAGTSGTAPFVASASGVVEAPQTNQQRVRAVLDQAAAGTTGGVTFSVNGAGEATRVTGSNQVNTDAQGRQTPSGTADPDAYHDGMSR